MRWRSTRGFIFLGCCLAILSPLGLLLYSYQWGPRLDQNLWQHCMNYVLLNQSTLIYAWGSTTFFFVLFGWWAGHVERDLVRYRQQLEQSLTLLQDFDRVKKDFLKDLADTLHSPVASAVELLESLQDGTIGALPDGKRKISENIVRDLRGMSQNFHDLVRFQRTRQSWEPVSVYSLLNQLGRHVVLGQVEDEFLYVEPALFGSALKRVVDEIHRQSTDLQIQISVVRRPILRDLPDQKFTYFVVESPDFTQFSDVSSWNWVMARNVFEWHGGHIWKDAHCPKGLRLFIAVPQLKGKTVSA